MKTSNPIIGRKTLISMLFTALTMLGIISYRNLPVELLPNAELPFLIVYAVSSQDIDPEHVEREAVLPLETAIGTLEDIDRIESFASPGRCMITVYYNQNISIKYAYLKLQQKIAAVRPTLPDEYFLAVRNIDTEKVSNKFMDLQVRGGGGLDRVRNIVDNEIRRELESIDGVANLEISGGREKSVEIILDDAVCEAYGITPSTVAGLIRRNGESNTFAGQIDESGRQYFVNVVSEYADISEIENITVNPTGPVLLRDVAEIYFGVKEQTSISRVNGKDAVTVSLVRESQVNMIDLSHRARKVVDRLNGEFRSRDIEIIVQNDISEIMEKNIDLIIKLALIGGLLAVVILWVFLRNLRLVLIIALAIPISVFTAFNFFYAAGITINSLTLIGMALAVGMLLDNSVVVLENIYRLVSLGRDPDTAVIEGVKEVWRSIFAATATTITVFLPFIFSSRFEIKLVGKHVGVSIISTLLVSLAVALLLVPMVTHFFLKRRSARDSANFQPVSGNNRIIEIYTVLLKSCLRYPARTIIGTIIVFFASIIICLGLSLNVSKESKATSITIYVSMPKGSSLETTDATVTDLESRFESIPEKMDMLSRIYEDEAMITITLKDNYREIDNRSFNEIKEDVRKRFEDYRTADVSFDPPQASTRYGRSGGMGMERAMMRMFGIGVQQEKVVIIGSNFEVMRDFGDDIKYHLENLSSVSSASMNVSDDRPEIHLHFDTDLMSYYDIPLSAIGSELRTFPNEFSTNLTYRQGTDEYDIVIRKMNQEQRRIEDLQRLSIQGGNTGSIELQRLSRIIYSHGLPSINRVNQEKQIEVTYRFSDEVNSSKDLLESARAEVDQLVAALVIPSGVAVEVVHEENEYGEYTFLIVAAFILIYMILASVFESLTTPVVMMFTVPLAAIGSFWMLIFTRTSIINLYTLTGFVILLGVVVNNGIILIDYSMILRRRGHRVARALLAAGRARTRPILITAATTIIAMIPLAMGKTEDVSIMGAPFAITVIGGLSLSTLFTLIFIPVVYSGLEAALSWMRRLDIRIKIAHMILFTAGCYLIFTRVDSNIWKLAFLSALLFSIPGATWFVMSSLRQAASSIIPEGAPITIEIRNLVKIFDHPSRFAREWNKGNAKRHRDGSGHAYRALSDFGGFAWQVPLLAFAVYFVYLYLNSFFWTFVLSHAVFFYILFLWNPVREFLEFRFSGGGRLSPGRWAGRVRPVLFWGLPLANLLFFYLRWHDTALVILIAALWYTALVIYTTSNRIHRDKVNIARISGRFSGLRKAFYRFVMMIPMIGRKKVPFKALDGVTLQIGKGMFGLLGPNGAGKTTLMRIICGIFDQSYGKIQINGIDVNEKREELQGLIGYLPQEFGTYENMTAWEFLNYQGILKGLTDRPRREKMVNYVLEAVHIEEHRDKTIGSFSGGMKQRVGIAQILLHLPRILVVDEPTAGLDPRERIRFRNLLVELSRERVVIFSTHIIEDIYSSCNRVAILDRGRLLYCDDPAKMTETARGHVWQFNIEPKDLETVRKTMLVVHHMRDGEKIRVRCLSRERPAADAAEINPTLEDAYLWMLRKKDHEVRQ